MGRSLVAQVRAVWSASRILVVGKSRFREKHDVREQLRAEGLGATSARIAERTSIASYRTYDAYRSVTADFARFAAAHGVARVQDLRPAHAEAFLAAKLAAGKSCNTLRTYSAALGKFDQALARAPRAMHIPDEARLSPGLEPARQRFNRQAPKLDTSRRAYADPCGLVRAVQDPGHQLVGRLQLEAGLRVSEALAIRRQDMRGEVVDPVTGRACGLVKVAGKGGFTRTQYVPQTTYRELVQHLGSHVGGMGQAYKPYLAALHRAADASGEVWGGTHGLRHNYVRNFLLEAVEAGLGTQTAMREAMERVGHHRLSELKTYLR